MKAKKQIVVAVSFVVISAIAPVVEAQQGVEKAAPGTLVAPADALNSLVKMTESQMNKSGEGIACGQVWICTKRGDFCAWATN